MAVAFRMAAGLLGWFALALQYGLVMASDFDANAISRTINFFSYFTILTNILAALALTLPGLAPQSAVARFFSRPSVRTAITGYIIIVMTIVYFVLRHLSNLQGPDLLSDVIPHYVMPILFVIDWLVLVPKETLKLKDGLVWLAFPIIYLIWTFIHGAYSGFYPYPFLNVGELRIARVLLNEAGLLALFLILGLLLVTRGRLIDKARKAKATRSSN
jgi:hypothetical protein